MPFRKVPALTVSRLSVYHRALSTLPDEWVISSEEISDLTGYTAAQIRRDLTYFGQFGTPGRGYIVAELRQRIGHILGIDQDWKVALVGVGHLGSALLAYQGFRERGFNIIAAFDNDITKIGKKWEGIVIEDISRLPESAAEKDIQMSILSVPAKAAREALNLAVAAGIKAILNFAPVRLASPEGIQLINVDLAAEMERLSFFLARSRS